jgi:hypothetical protein
MLIVDKIKADIIPATISASVAVLADKYILGNSLTAKANLFGLKTQRWVSVGTVVFTSDMIAEVLKDSAMAYMPMTMTSKYSMDLIKPLISGVSTTGLDYFGDRSLSAVNGFLLGAGSTLAGSYITKSFIKKKCQQ